MSGLARRLSELERRLGPCPGCARRMLELVQAEKYRPARAPTELCALCGEPLERITVLVAFDPNWGDQQ